MKFVKTVHKCPICKQKYKTFQDAYKCHLKCLQNKKLEGESKMNKPNELNYCKIHGKKK